MKLVSLISGGIDSPVAAHLMLRQGVDIIAVHCDNRPFTDEKEVEKARRLVKRLEEVSGRKIKLYMIPHGANQLEIARSSIRRFGCVLCRRMMFRVAERIAQVEGAQGILTGESLGQVASQTLKNIRVEEEAVSIPIIRPLIGFDKVEVERIAKEMGTYEISIMPGMCCTIVPEVPATQARLEQVLEEEKKMDIGALLEKSIKGAEIVE